jgi:hypothetical protein
MTLIFIIIFQVLHFHLVLGVQNLLRLRIHAARVPHFDSSDDLCDNRLHIFPAKCRRLQVAMDCIPLGRLNICLCVYLRFLLLFLQDQVSAIWPFKIDHYHDTSPLSLACRMYGLFQTVFYFGYMALFSGVLGIICGTVGYIGTTFFVRKIYSNVKID